MAEQQNSEQLELMREMAKLARERTEMAKKRTEMSATRSTMSAERSEMSAQRTYMNTERTLSVWIRTSLSAMIFGIAIDRLGLLFKGMDDTTFDFLFIQGTASAITGAILVIFSMLMAISATARFMSFAWNFKKKHSFPAHHKPLLPIVYALMIVIFSGVLLTLMLGIV